MLMSYRMLPLVLAVLALAVFVAAPVLADDTKANTHTGTLVSATGNQIVMKAGTGTEAKEHKHAVAANARIMCDGKECKLADLKPGQKIRVTVQKDTTTGKDQVTKLEALDKQASFDRAGSK
jgi:hypothetical protein